MNYFTKTRILITIIVVLAITLLATIGTMVYSYYKQKQVTERFSNNPSEQMDRQAQYLNQRLNLTPEQQDMFCISRNEFHNKTIELNRQIQRVSVEIINELSAPEPNSKLIDSLIEQYGELHKIQKQNMVDHLTEIKSVCTPEQFNEFQRILDNSRRRQMQMHRHRQRSQYERLRRGDSITPRF